MSVFTEVNPAHIESTTSRLSGKALVSRVSELSPRFRERVPITEGQRSVARESIDELLEAGVARLMVPREYGGNEGRLRDLVELSEAAAYGCPSTGWIASLLAHNPHVLAMFPAEAQAAVWRQGPDVIVAGSVAPTARVTTVEGGYRITGKHAFTSGINNAAWIFVGGMVMAEAGPPEWRLFLVEKKDFVIEDVWHTAAMRGTGSNTAVIEDVFVPEGFTMLQLDAREGTGPGGQLHSDPKYRLPWLAYATLGFTATMLGATQGAYDYVCKSLGKKRSPSGERVAEGQILQVEIAFAAGKISTARKLLMEIADRADSGGAYTLEERATIGRDNTLAAMLLTEAIETLLTLSGTGAFILTSPVQQAWRDLHFAAAHTSVNKTESGGRFGRLALGVEETHTVGFF